MNCPKCQAPLCNDWTRCGMCGRQRLERSSPSNAADCYPSSDTPETDLLEFEVLDDCECGINVVSSTLARKLEREREEARFSAAYWRDIAAGKFAQAAVLPWESPENVQSAGDPEARTNHQ